MRTLRRISYLVNKRRLERELAEELELHRTLSADTTRFGSGALARNHARDVWIWPWLQDAAQDVRFAARLLIKDRAFTFVAVAVLGLGIGVDNTMLMAVNAACLRGLPIADADRVLFIGARDRQGNDANVSYREFEAIAGSAPAFSGIAAHASASASVGDEVRAADRAALTYLSPGAFALLGERPILGRNFSDDDQRPGAASVTILGGGLWTRRYGADPAIVGTTIRVNGIRSTVIGVVRAGFKFPRFAELWQPLQQMPQLTEQRTARRLELFGRLRDAGTIGDARGQIDRTAARLARQFPDTNQQTTFRVVPINDRYNQRITAPSWIGFMITGALVLMIACANVANLLLMRSAQRAQEFAIRASLGASRTRLVRQLLIECAALASLGGLAGWAFATAGGRLLTNLVPETQMPFWIRFTMDTRMLVILSIVTLTAVFVFGLAPALHAARTDVNEALKDGARTSAGSARTGRLTSMLLIGEFALSVVLVTMLIKGERLARAAERAGTGYDTNNVVSGSLVLPVDRYRGPGDRLALYEQIEQRLAGMRVVESFAFASALPGTGASSSIIEIEGAAVTRENAPKVWTLTVGPRYFDVLGAPLIRGRQFDDRDGATGAGAAIVNQQVVDRYFKDADPIGRRIRLIPDGAAPSADPPWLVIAGVAPTLRQRPTPDPDPIVYLPIRGGPPAAAVALARAASAPAGPVDSAPVAAALRDVVRAINPDLPLARLMPLAQAVGEAQWAARGSTRISETVVLIAIVLAAAGLYAVTAHAVVLRTAEISVRRALGAGASHIVWMVWRRASVQIAIGGAIGVAGAVAWQRISGAWLAEPGSAAAIIDPIDFMLVVVFVAAIGIAACLLPAWQAVRLDPLQALRRQ